ncbi:C1 family peptidase [Novosphingobium sp.]|uniref:C1 family peptidase n=1 Tax=Novosphingobium sp. TaxID=1874826 RepID=UPI003B521B95
MGKMVWLGGVAALAAGMGVGAFPLLAGDTVAPPPALHTMFVTGADPIDPADYETLPKLGTFRAFLPKSVDLTPFFPKPGYQGQQPDCVAWATTYAARGFLSGREMGHQPSLPAEEMSPAYVYNRLRRPGSLCDRPTKIVDALGVLQHEGTVTFADFPDDVNQCTTPAPQSLISKAALYRLGGWRAIEHETSGPFKSAMAVDDIKGALAQGQPVVFAMPVADDWYAVKDATVYTHRTPEHANFHAMTVIGYDEDRQALRVINSWGTDWGDHGYAWIGYDTFRTLVYEAYALHDMPHADTAHSQPGLSPRQTLDADLAKLPCGSAQVKQVGGHLSVTGFAGGKDTLDELHAALLAVDPHAGWSMAYHPWPQCEAELTVGPSRITGDVAMVAMTDSGAARSGDPVIMRAGELFGIGVDVPAGKPELSIVYVQADGSAVELFRGTVAPGTPGHHSVVIGLDGAKAARFQVGPPFGNEMVIALASDRRLFGNELSDYASERQFLTALRARLTTVPAGAVSASILRLRTHD